MPNLYQTYSGGSGETARSGFTPEGERNMTTAQDTTLEIGNKLVALCNEGKNLEAIETLYSPAIESVEACSGPDMDRVMKGIDAIKGKNQWWIDNHEVHSSKAAGPYLNEDRFTVIFDIDVTFKPKSQRCQMREVALYTVKDGRIVKEEFFYTLQ